MTLKAMIETRNSKVDELKQLVDTAKGEERVLTDEEQAAFENLKKEIEDIDRTIAIEKEVEDMALVDVHEPVPGTDQESIADVERRQFENYLRDPQNADFTKGANGAVIPTTIADKIIAAVYDICPVLERSTKYNVKGNLIIPYYDESTSAITVAYQNEFSSIQSSGGQFTSQITLSGFLAGALAKISRSLMNNTEFNIVDFVVNKMAEAIARFIEKEILVGTTGYVTGLSTLTNGITASSATALTADDVVKLHDAVKDVYQQNAMWVMSSATRTALRLLKGGDLHYLLQDDISAPFGLTLLGKPVYVSDNMPDIATGATVIYYGDFSGVATKFNEEVEIQILRERYADEHVDGVIGWFEFDAKVEDNQKIAKLTMA